MVRAPEIDLVLTTRHRHGVVQLTLNRPRALNAFSAALYNEATSRLRALSADPSVRIILLTGAGETFCAGMDVKEASSTTQFRIVTRAARHFMHALMDARPIVVVAVFGPVVGIGVTLLLHVDFAFCAADATFQTPFARIGIVPEFASSYTFPRALGNARAARLLLRGERLPAAQMRDVCEVVDGGREKTVAAAREFAVTWSAETGDEQWDAITRAKALLRERLRADVEEALDAEFAQIDELVASGRTARLMRRQVEALRKAKL